MTRLRICSPLALSLVLLLSAGCSNSAPKDAPAGDPPAGGASDAPATEEHSADDGHDHGAEGGDIGGTGMVHKEGTVAGAEETFVVGGEGPQSGTAHDGWTVNVTSMPAQPVIGPVIWSVIVTGPEGAAVTPGQLLIEPEAQEVNTGKKLPLEVTAGDPGTATVKFMVETAGSYEVEFHLHRSDGGDSHVKATFVVA